MPAALSVRCSVTSTGSSFQLHTRGDGGGGVYCQCCMPATVKRHQCHLSSGLTHPSTTHSEAATASRACRASSKTPSSRHSRVLQLGGQLITREHEDGDEYHDKSAHGPKVAAVLPQAQRHHQLRRRGKRYKQTVLASAC